MSKKPYILVFEGSPRLKGNSTVLAEKAAEGARAAGAEVETFFLHKMKVEPCSACDACLTDDDADCIIEDDMVAIYPKLRRADAILFASPIYWFTYSAQLKLLVDRMYALEGSKGSALKGKSFGVILVYGDSDPYNSGATNAIRSFQDMCRYLGSELVDVVYGSASNVGDVAKQPALLDKAYSLGQKLAQR